MDAFAKKLGPAEKLCPAHPLHKIKFRYRDEYLCSECVTLTHLQQGLTLAKQHLERDYIVA